MKSLTYSRCFAFLPLALACSASPPPPRGTGSAGGEGGGGGISASNGGSTTGAVGMTSGGTTLGFGGGGGGGGEINCGIQKWTFERKPADVLLVLDRSASMEQVPEGATDTTLTKWKIVIPAVTEVIADTNTAVAWGMKTFPEGEGTDCIAGSVTSKIDVEIAANNAAAVNAQIMLTNDRGNGTPTGDAIDAAVQYLKTVNDEHPKYILLATDGEPSCDGTTHDSAPARTAAISAIQTAFEAGIPTFVVGVATSEKTTSGTLNNMALAGGRAQGGVNPLAIKYYLADSKDDLVTALTAITGDVNKSCVFPLDPPPPAPDFIRVEVRGIEVKRDTTRMNGWDYTAANHTALEVFGQACEDIKNPKNSTTGGASAGGGSGAGEDKDKILVKYGCLGVIPT